MPQENEIKITPSKVEDAQAIAQILHELNCFDHLQKEKLSETESRIAKHLKNYNTNCSHTLLVAKNIEGKVIGYVAVHWLPYLILKSPEGYISELFVQESFRGKGIGQKLLEAVKKEAKKRNCSRLNLLNNRNRPSYKRGFYQKLGWEERTNMANHILKLD